MKKLFIAVIGLILFNACEEDITLDLPASPAKVVVDGYVEAGSVPYIILSRSEGYFDAIGQSTLNNLPVQDARVFLSNGTDTVQLTEIDSVIDGISIGGFYMAIDSVSYLPTMIGTPGLTYTLQVLTKEGEVVSANAFLPEPIALDSVWFKLQPNSDSLGWAWARLSDPDTLGNYYRWFAKRANKTDDFFIAPLGSVFEDKFINGQSFDFAYNRGSIQNSTAEDDNNEEAGFYKTGDTIIVKFCTVDRGTFEFWRDAETQLSNNGSPFAVPSNVKSNVIGGRGLFATYSASYATIIAQ